jgi:CheY-like chemotaxis protein
MFEPGTAGRSEDSEPNLDGKIMVIAEDDQYSFEYLKLLFRRTGLEIIHAKNGFHLMKILEQQIPDLVLLDIHMPEMNGYDCLKKIKAYGIQTKVIVQTASDISTDRERSLQAGADSFISKPIRKNELFRLINRVMKSA